MADQTYQFACDNSAYVTVSAQTTCNRITIAEYYTSASPSTTDLLVKQPASATNPAPVLQGTSYVFTPPQAGFPFTAGQPVGSVKTVSGSVTIIQVEGEQA